METTKTSFFSVFTTPFKSKKQEDKKKSQETDQKITHALTKSPRFCVDRNSPYFGQSMDKFPFPEYDPWAQKDPEWPHD